MKTNDRAPAAGWAAEAPEIRVGVTNSSVNTCGDCTVHHLLATSPTRDMLAAALMLAQNSYAVHWLRPRNKAPVAAGWSMAPVADVLTLSQTYRPGNNVGVRCGSWSQPMPDHGLVVVDVDIRALEATEPALAAVAELCGGSHNWPVVLSGSGNGSRHLWFACPLDRLPPKANVTIWSGDGWKLEVLSTGKQIVAPPSIHPSGQPYQWLIPLTDMLPLLPESVHAAIETMNTPMSVPNRTALIRSHSVPRVHHVSGYRPGDDFNRRASWQDILEPYGWVPVRGQGKVVYWRRPGKSQGISATTNHAGYGLLYVFSTNAAPFEANIAYTPFVAYALLAHCGDFRRAAQVLQEQGYGIQHRYGLRTIRAWPLALRTVNAEEVRPWR